MENAVWLSIIGAIIALDYAMLGQFMISQPIVSGAIFGWLLGDIQSGIVIGAMIQLLWVGVLPVGAYIPSDHTVTGGVAACMALMLMTKTGMPLNQAAILALAVAIPAGYLSGKLDILVRQVNNQWNHWIEQGLEKQSLHRVNIASLLGLLLTFMRNLIIYIIWLGAIAWGMQNISQQLPEVVKNGLALAFWLLPAVSLAVIIDMIIKEHLMWWIVGAMALMVPVSIIWTGQLFYLMLVVMAVGSVIAAGKRSW